MKPEFDQLGLLASRKYWTINFGAADVSAAMTHFRTKSALNSIPDAELTLSLRFIGRGLFDYFAPIRVTARQQEAERPRFLGTVVSSRTSGEEITMTAMSAISLAERYAPYLTTRGITAPELIYALARSAGFKEEQLKIQGLANLPRETFEVVAPIDGLDVDDALDFAGVRFLPREAMEGFVSKLKMGEQLHNQYKASTYAVSLVTTDRCLAAEERGLAAIDLAIAWLTTRLRYGFPVLPNGSILSFDRGDSLAKPRRRTVVALRGTITSRQWLRDPLAATIPLKLKLKQDSHRFSPQLPSLSLQERLAILALHRATVEPNTLAGVLALFEAIEFYAASASVEEVFNRHERREVRKSIPKSLSDEQKRRVDQMIGKLNDAPLRTKLIRALDEDAVPMATAEIDLLWKLRQVRNEVVHGRKSELPDAEDLESAISLVSRMLIYRMARHN